MHIGRMKTVAKATPDIVVADSENRHARSTGRLDDTCQIADAARDMAALAQCSEAPYLVPEERDLEVGNFAVADGMCSVPSLHIGLTPTAGTPRYSRLHHTARMGALTPYCA